MTTGHPAAARPLPFEVVDGSGAPVPGGISAATRRWVGWGGYQSSMQDSTDCIIQGHPYDDRKKTKKAATKRWAGEDVNGRTHLTRRMLAMYRKCVSSKFPIGDVEIPVGGAITSNCQMEAEGTVCIIPVGGAQLGRQDCMHVVQIITSVTVCFDSTISKWHYTGFLKSSTEENLNIGDAKDHLASPCRLDHTVPASTTTSCATSTTTTSPVEALAVEHVLCFCCGCFSLSFSCSRVADAKQTLRTID